ncbi:hypothetical protein [Streptomyces murinus]
MREAGRAGLERVWREMPEGNGWIRGLEMGRDVLKRCVVFWVK